MVKAVLFDMDGLLFDTEQLGVEAWEWAGKQLGYEIPPELPLKVLGQSGPQIEAAYCEALGPDFDYEACWDLKDQYTRDYIEEHGMPLKPGSIVLMEYLKENGYQMAIASSNAAGPVQFYLTHSGFEQYFQVVVSGNMVAHGKPEPDVFLLAAQKLGREPAECMVLEDSFNGVIAAGRAGMRVIMVPDLVPPTPEIDALLYGRCGSLSGVIDLLQRARGEDSR